MIWLNNNSQTIHDQNNTAHGIDEYEPNNKRACVYLGHQVQTYIQIMEQ